MSKRPSADGAQGKGPGAKRLRAAWRETKADAASVATVYNVSPPQGNIVPGEPKPKQKKDK
jgi:hypothetical protein